jgi:mRNA interferase RelE/StbE
VKKIVWSDPARADIRRLDRETAMRIFTVLHRFAHTGAGDIKRLQGSEDFRLRAGDWRIRLSLEPEDAVRHRSEVYRSK